MHRIRIEQINQRLVLGLLQRRKKIGTNYLLVFRHRETRQSVSVIPRLVSENGRYTVLEIDTNADLPAGSAIKISRAQESDLKVYAQNSGSNLDPADPTVIDEIHFTSVQFVGEEEAPTVYINDEQQNTIVYGQDQ